MILKIDEATAEHRRQPPDADRRRAREDEEGSCCPRSLPGQLRKGTVKNIADFGAFVDLGGIDGLLHITDMSWGRISHPSEMVKIDEEIEVQILQRRPRQGKDRPRPQAEVAQPLGTGQREVPGRHEGQGRQWST